MSQINIGGFIVDPDVLSGITSVSSTYGILVSDKVVLATSGSFTATLPTAAGCTGQVFDIKNSGTGIITIATTSSQTIDGNLTIILNPYDDITVVSTGSNWIIK